MPATKASLRVQLFAAHVQPVPAMDTSVSPDGTVSVTVTVPLVGPAPAPFNTVTVYVAPCCPCVKFPAWDFAISSDGRIALPAVKVTVTVGDPVIVTVQLGGFVCGLVGVQFVLKLVNVEFPVGVAVSTTWVPLSKFAEHVVGQLIPVGLLVTVPVPVPAASVTVRAADIIWHSAVSIPGLKAVLDTTSILQPLAT
jgi:hypothetical protein